MAKPLECMHCKEIETVLYLFFECIVARQIWAEVEKLFQLQIANSESVAKLWLCNRRYLHLNVVTSAVLWGLRNFRNSIVFNRVTWISMKQVLGLVSRYLRDWTKPFQELQGGALMEFQALVWMKLKTPFALETD